MIRCAIYTRKSTDNGLERDYNSLDAQFDACRAYIQSQAHDNWRFDGLHFKDAAKTGAHLERSGLSLLLKHVVSGDVDMVVVHKIDRLTRSLADFAKLATLFEKHNANFVSVTQSLDTSNSVGRLSLNMLLSFAQFEREIASERMREKILASRKKGRWTGGSVPLGYSAHSGYLLINHGEAQLVELIYKLYADLGSATLVRKAIADDIASIPIELQGRAGRLSRGAIYTVLKNPIYVGLVRAGEELVSGLHEPIIDKSVWDLVQQQLRHRPYQRRLGKRNGKLGLLGKLWTSDKDRLTRSHTKKRGGKRYAYYVCAKSTCGELEKARFRIPCEKMHEAVANAIRSDLKNDETIALIVDSLTGECAAMGTIENVLADTSSHQRINELLDAVFSVRVGCKKVKLRYSLIDALSLADAKSFNHPIEREVSFPTPAQWRVKGRNDSLAVYREQICQSALISGQQWVADLYQNRGSTTATIASKHGVSRMTVYRTITRALES
ncbi:MAG: recombinase family protein [Pseudomonadota bacterium]